MRPMGLRYQIEETELAISRCFRCHTTGPVSFSPEYEVQITEPGVRCEVCHGPGSAHLEAVSRGALHEARKLIQNPNRLSAPELNEFLRDLSSLSGPSRRPILIGRNLGTFAISPLISGRVHAFRRAVGLSHA